MHKNVLHWHSALRCPVGSQWSGPWVLPRTPVRQNTAVAYTHDKHLQDRTQLMHTHMTNTWKTEHSYSRYTWQTPTRQNTAVACTHDKHLHDRAQLLHIHMTNTCKKFHFQHILCLPNFKLIQAQGDGGQILPDRGWQWPKLIHT